MGAERLDWVIPGSGSIAFAAALRAQDQVASAER